MTNPKKTVKKHKVAYVNDEEFRTKTQKDVRTYKTLLVNLSALTESELRKAIQEEINKANPRPDMLARMVGRYNRVRGARAMTGVLGLLSYKGKRDVSAVLDSNG